MAELEEAVAVTEDIRDIREQAEKLGYEVKQRITSFYTGRSAGPYGTTRQSGTGLCLPWCSSKRASHPIKKEIQGSAVASFKKWATIAGTKLRRPKR